MNHFFEEDGAFKVGSEISSTETACQVELPTGKRVKVKKNHILVSFSPPTPTEFLDKAQTTAEEMDLELLWEFAPSEEFDFKTIAQEYFGDDVLPYQLAATLIRLHSNPVYFYRKGRGQYRKAPEETLKLALAAIEKKRKLEEIKDSYVKDLCEYNKAPEAIAQQAVQLIVKPDKNSIEWKALKEASDKASLTPLRLLLNVGAIKNAWRWHVESFFSINFPKGKKFSSELPEPQVQEHDELPLSNVVAFSIDDSNTTEVDDALSVTLLEGNRTRVGIHISAPGLGIEVGSPVDLAARERMSTVYAPGLKTTMLPESWIKAYSLDEGKISPVVSLYAVVDNEDYSVLSTETRLERIRMASNLRYDKIESQVTEEKVLSGQLEVPFGQEIIWLWHFAKTLLKKREEVRGKPELTGRIDWYFDLKGEDENAEIELKGRKRGDPLDLLVAEMMIFANSTWGGWLDERKVVGIYRAQRQGRVKLTSVPGPHDGIGVPFYSWSTSPLRRYVDMVNQRQMIMTLKGLPPPYRQNDSELFAVISSFDAAYSTFNDFQSRMDRYWSMRWIEQEKVQQIKTTVVKGDLVRIDGLPMMQRVPGLGEYPRGQTLLMQVLNLDYLELVMELRLIEVLDQATKEELDEDELEQDSATGEEDSPEDKLDNEDIDSTDQPK